MSLIGCRESDVHTTTGYANSVDRDEVMRVLRAFQTAGLEYVLIGAAGDGIPWSRESD